MDYSTFQSGADFTTKTLWSIPSFCSQKANINAVPFLFNLPHSGRCYSQDFMKQTNLDPRDIRLSEDCYVDLLFNNVTNFGASFFKVNFPRSFVDVNRKAFDLDIKMFKGVNAQFINNLKELQNSLYIRAGYGVIPRNVAAKKAIYKGKIAFSQAIERLLNYYFPYHAALLEELIRLREKFGEAVLIDCHSMPSLAQFYPNEVEPDVILGDCHGNSCAPQLIETAHQIFEKLGYRVARNYPYAGGFITEHYGQPQVGIHALQIELNRKLYLSPLNYQPSYNFSKLKADLEVFSKRLIENWQLSEQNYLAAQ